MFAIQGFMNYFADIGLAAALVQKKGEVTKKDLSTTFIVQQTLIITLLLVLTFNVSKIQQFFNLSGESQALLYAFAFAFFLSSLKTIPSVLLERKIQFEKLIIPQIAEVLIYNIVGVFLVWKGFGLLSFVYAIVLSRVIGLILNGLPFSISAGIGYIALSGIAVLNGVVLVNFFNQLKVS